MKKAVSPLISVMLVLVFTVFIGMAISSWVFDYTKTTTTAATNSATGPKGITYCANSNVEISNVALRDVLVASNTSVSSGAVNYFNLTSLFGTPTITFTGVAGSSYADGLAGWWHFDEGSGMSTSDSSLNSNVGTLNGAMWNTSGQFDDALQFDGDDNVTIADSATLDMTDTITLSAWVNVNTDTSSTYSISPISATGGTVTYDGDYTIHTFTEDGIFHVTGSGNVEVLVVAGGGGGLHYTGYYVGGGGGGGLVYNSSFRLINQPYEVVVGNGGYSGQNGQNSIFSNIIAYGGGYGDGKNGGSGGGSVATVGSNWPGGLGVIGQGNNGGIGQRPSDYIGGGGGGAGSVGASPGSGGVGLQYNISGTSIYYAGGGGGGSGSGSPQNGGLGGGGSGGVKSIFNPSNGTPNTGGGGGGSGGDSNDVGSYGGSGIVIIRYQTPNTFSNRKPINISHSGALTDYQTKLNVNYESEMLSNFDDIRFVTDSGVHVPYWIENKTDGVTADVWIKSNLTDGNTTIWMYYGNAGLSSGSNGDDTFVFFDDFEDGTLDKWNVPSSQTTISTDWVNGEGTYVVKHVHVVNSGYGFNTYIDDIDFNVIMDFKTVTANNVRIYLYAGGVNNVITNYGQITTQINYKSIPITNYVGPGVTLLRWDQTFGSGSSVMYFDNIRIVKYTSTEPTYTIGAAESLAQSFVLSKSGAYSLGANTTHASATINDQTITATISAGWNHIALTYDKNAGTSQMKLYIDGVSSATWDYNTSITTNINDVIIGNNFNGTIDEVRIYNKTLSASEITDTYNTSTLSTTTEDPKASINGYANVSYGGMLSNGATITLTIDSDNFTVGTNNITIYTDAGDVDYEIKMNGLSAVVSNTGMNNVTVKQVVAFKADGSNCLFPNSNNTFEVGGLFSVSGCPMSCDEFLTIKAYTDCTGVFGEFAGLPNSC